MCIIKNPRILFILYMYMWCPPPLWRMYVWCPLRSGVNRCPPPSRTRQQVADRLEAAVNAVLDKGYRTGDLYKEGQQGTTLVKCSEMGKLLEDLVAA